MTSVLSRADIRRLLNQQPPLVAEYIDLEEQLQPNGFDLSLRQVAMLQTASRITFSNQQRLVSELAPLVFDGMGYLDLIPGSYIITYNEVVHLPPNLMALARPRSSLLRSGVDIGAAVWDAGYHGRSQSLMVVHNPHGLRVQKDARVAQLVFFRLTGETEGYQGSYQGENVT